MDDWSIGEIMSIYDTGYYIFIINNFLALEVYISF